MRAPIFTSEEAAHNSSRTGPEPIFESMVLEEPRYRSNVVSWGVG